MAAPAAEDGDEALATRAAAGEQAAFEELVSRYQARVYRLACRLAGDDGDAKDVLQEAFLAAYRGLPAFRAEARFSTWLYRIATNAALMQRRARARRLTESLEAFLPRFDEEGGHAAERPRCVAFVESYRQTPRILRAATAASLPDDLAESLRRFLASRR